MSSFWKFIEVTHSRRSGLVRGSALIIILLKLFFLKVPDLSTGVPRRRSPPKIAARLRYRLPSNNLRAHYISQFFVGFHFGLPRKPKNAFEHVWIRRKYNIVNFKSSWGCLRIDCWSCVHPLYAGKNCNGNPISTFPPCYAFQIIFTAFSPRLIQSISRNVHDKIRALKWLCSTVQWSAVQCCAVQCITVQYRAVQCSAVRCSAVQCSAVQCSAVQCSAVQYSAVQCSAVQCSAVQCVTVLCSKLQYSVV